MSGETSPTHKNHRAYFVPGLYRGLQVLEAFAEAQRPLCIADIAKRVSLSRSAVFRIVYTLKLMDFLEASPDNKEFVLGPRVLNIGFAYLSSKDIIEVARPELERLRDETNVSTHLAINSDMEVLYLSCSQTRSGFLSNMNVGTRVPAYASPMGWLLLSSVPPTEIVQIYADEPLVQLTDQTPKDIDSLVARVAQAAAKGYVVSRGVMEVGGTSISAPVLNEANEIAAAIDISGPDSAFDLSKLESHYVPMVTDTARRISARLGSSRAIVRPVAEESGPRKKLVPQRRGAETRVS